MNKKGNIWYRLDNAAKIYPSITRTRVSTLFRISVTLKERVNSDAVQLTLKKVIERFPYFRVNLKRGLFWYYYEFTEKMPVAEEETFYPCMFHSYKKEENFPFRVLYYKNRISFEFSHSVTDGTGALIFAKTFVTKYFEEIGIESSGESDIFNINEKPDSEEWKDSFKKYFKRGIPSPDTPKKAVHLPYKLVPKGEYYILTGISRVEEIKKSAEKYGITINQYLIVLYFEAIQEFIYKLPEKIREKYIGRIVINCPVNIRRIFPSKSMRNFFISLTPEIDLRLGSYTREELAEYVKNYMKMNISEKNFIKYIYRNVSNERSFFIRLIPLFIKNMAMGYVYNVFGESGYTSSISNLGEVKFSKELTEKIERVEFYPPPSRGNVVKAGAVSFNGKIYISFGKLTKDSRLEKYFFRKIRRDGAWVKVETNME